MTGSVNYPNLNIDQTVRIFDDFYKFDQQISAAEFDLVLSFFLREMGNRTVANNFAVSLFQVANEFGVPALTLLKQLEGAQGVNLDLTMAYLLNQIRSRATLLGVGVPVTPNFYAARNVVQ